MTTSPFDARCVQAAKLWRESGRAPSTIAVYLKWVRRFHADCVRRGVAEDLAPTRDVVDRFALSYARRRGCNFEVARTAARNALHAWWYALGSLAPPMPAWTEPGAEAPLPPVIAEFVRYRLRHRGIATSSVRGDVRYVSLFLAFLRTKRRALNVVRLGDVDEFVGSCSARWTHSTVAGICSVLRAFLRFRFASGHLRHDLGPALVSPRVQRFERPPRAMPWQSVQRLLRAIDVRDSLGVRDFALLLTMAAYGMGAGEVLGLRVDDIDWQARVLHVRRPKTGNSISLPLLGPVARALAKYLRRGRPPSASAREIFLSHGMPFHRLTGASAIRHRLVKYATAAGLTPSFIGSHVLRHSHASRQIELGATPKVIGDILGHRRPSSTSAYLRVATERLRDLALPVPS